MKRSALKSLALLLILSGLAFAQQPVNDVMVSGTAISTGNGVSGAGSQRVNIASDNTAFAVNATLQAGSSTVGKFDLLGNTGATVDSAPAATAATNLIQVGGIFTTTPATLTTGQAGALELDAAENLLVNLKTALPAGTNTVGKVDLLGNAGAIMDFAGQNAASPANSLQVGGQFNTTPTTLTSGDSSALQLNSAGQLLVACTGCSASSTVTLVPLTTGGLSTKHFVAAASDNATNLKASAGQVYSIDIYNNAAYPVYLKLYNASSSPTGCGATNLFKVVGVQSGTQHILQSEQGWALGTGIGYCATKGIADSDDTALLLSDATFDIGYK